MNKFVETDLGSQEIFSKNLIRYLTESGKTQKEVADAIGVSAGTFCDYVKCRAYPRMDKVQKLADFFGINKSDLVEKWNPEKDEDLAADQKVLEMFHKVPKEKREFVLSLIQTTIDNLQLL